MKAFGWAADNAGCYFYRIATPLDTLSTSGWEVEHGTKFTKFPDGPMGVDDKRLPELANKVASELDVVIAQRTCNLAPSVFWQILNKSGAFTVYEIDDDLFNIHPTNRVAYELYSRPDIRTNMIDNIRCASRVTCSTEPLAKILREYNSDVRVCPNGIPDWMLNCEPPRLDNSKVTIGWGGSPTHDRDFLECEDQLRQFLNRRNDIELHVIGTNYAEWMSLPRDKCRFTPWLPSVPDFLRSIDYDIGIAPLSPHKFNKSKSYIKVLECAALGIPVIASDCYPYKNFILHGQTGYLVKYPHEWGRYLRILTEDPVQRAEMGTNARKQAAHYTMSQMAPVWKEALTPCR